MTPTKETLETANSAAETTVSTANTKAKPDSSRMRADAVSLEVPVKVHGSRVTEVVMGTTPHTEPFEEQTTTMIVFPQGGVLKMSTTVGAGQMMVVTNLKSGHDAICRVVKVRAYGQGQSYVEIEFTHRQAGYWGVYFPSDGTDAASQSAAPAAAIAPIAPTISVDVKVEKAEEKSAHETSVVAPPPAVKPPAPKPAAKPDSAFAQIGSQEDVQPAAASTSTRVRPSPLVEAELNRGREAAPKFPAVETPRVSAPPLSSSAPSLSISDLQGDARAVSSVSLTGAGVPGELSAEEQVEADPAEAPHAAESAVPAPAFGRLAATASMESTHASSREFGSGLGSSSLSIGGREPAASGAKQTNWLAIAASAIATVGVGLGAAYFLHLPPFAAHSAKPAVPIVAPAAPPLEATTESNPTAQPVNPAPVQSTQVNQSVAPSVAAAAPVVMHTSPPPPSPKSSKPSAVAPAPAPTVATETPKSTAKVPDMFGALNAHPTSHSRAGDAGESAAPSLDASAAPENIGGLPSIASGPAAPVAPAAQGASESDRPVRVGGQIKPPRLVSSVMPEYPSVARNAGVEGDVVIDTTLDKNGRVTAMKVISGPVLLRQAAVSALREWKYQPSLLNGEPVPVQMTVTIKFHRQ